MLLTFLLVLGAHASVFENPWYRPQFHHADCARWLFERVEDLKDQRIKTVDSLRGALLERIPVFGIFDEPTWDLSEDWIWFTSDPDAPAEETLKLIAAARARLEAKIPPREEGVQTVRFEPTKVLSTWETSALGITYPGALRPANLRGLLITSPKALSITWFVRRIHVGELKLTRDDIELGYVNSVYQRQLEHLLPRPGRPNLRPPRLKLDDFMDTELRGVFTRRDERGSRFGYLYDVITTATGEVFHQIEVVMVKPSERSGESSREILFPRVGDPRPDRLNLRLSDSGLRLRLTSILASE